jgi:drug/metabolite transporter (DMT)-like permease
MRYYVYLALAPLFWAGNWVAARGVHELISPIGLNFSRWIIASLVLIPISLPSVIRQWPIIRQEWGRLFLLSLMGSTLFSILVFWGLHHTTAINAVVLNSSLSFFIILGSWLFLRDRMTKRQAVGMVLSVIGVLIVIGKGDPTFLLHLEFGFGDMLILLAMPLWAAYSVVIKTHPTRLDSMGLVAVTSFMAAVMCTLCYGVEVALDPSTLPEPGFELISAIIYIALFPSIAAVFCWNEGIKGLSPNMASYLYPLMPAYGTILSVFFLGEELHMFQLVGLVVILAGVYICTLPKRTA